MFSLWVYICEYKNSVICKTENIFHFNNYFFCFKISKACPGEDWKGFKK